METPVSPSKTSREGPRDRPVPDAGSEDFLVHRELLFSIVYNMLGTVTDTEDVVQETWLSWAAVQDREIAHPRAYLVRIAVNHALTQMRRARRSRESYIGPWLPEPVLTGPDTPDTAIRTESVSLAMLVVLETLTPLQRAVFVLREAFAYDHAEIAAILGRSSAAVRQLAHRAKERVEARRPRYDLDRGTQRIVTERFLDAALGGDLDALMDVLAPEVVMWSDGGGKRRAALRVVEGRDKVARLVAGVSAQLPTFALRPVQLNGGPGVVLFAGGTLYAAAALDPAPGGDRVRGIYGLVNPDKLAKLAETVRPG
ncbi:RNA polymerase sigma factor SigJ [Streptomyces yatensis]|nr:RNA polymerase sigma factor SigJ [Streptomyces yatensis]